jgi:hypothetical protein
MPGAERGQRFELQVIDVDDVPTGWRLQPNHAVGLDDLHPSALPHTSVANPLLEYTNRTPIPLLGAIVTRDLRPDQVGQRLKIMDLIVDDPDINPDFRQWGFRLHGGDKQYLEIIGNQVFIKAGIVTVEMGHPDYYSKTTLSIGLFEPLYIELMGLDEAYLFIFFIDGNRPSYGNLQIRLQTPEAAPPPISWPPTHRASMTGTAPRERPCDTPIAGRKSAGSRARTHYSPISRIWPSLKTASTG